MSCEVNVVLCSVETRVELTSRAPGGVAGTTRAVSLSVQLQQRAAASARSAARTATPPATPPAPPQLVLAAGQSTNSSDPDRLL